MFEASMGNAMGKLEIGVQGMEGWICWMCKMRVLKV